MFNFFNKTNIYNLLCNFSIAIFLLIFFYKLYIESFIPVRGDELNNILVYSSNIKTVFLKNFPGNITFFNFIGLIKSSFFGFELNSFRIITFIFIILHFWILKKMEFCNYKKLLFLILLIESYLSFYAGQYNGYIFSSFIFIYIFYLLNNNNDEKNNRIILVLLFIQFYNHLVNLYLVLPIIVSMFILLNKKKFIKDFMIFFLLPVLTFYSFSVILTGIALLKVPYTNFSFVLSYLFKNFMEIVFVGFDRIFFYEAFIEASNFSIFDSVLNLYLFDKIIFIFLFFVIFLSIVNLKIKKINLVFSLIIVFHIITIILINKNPAPRIFTGFFAFYVFYIFEFLKNFPKINNFFNSNFSILSILTILVISTLNFDYLNKIKNNKHYSDFNFSEDKVSNNFLKNNCKLANNNFSEMQKKNFYFNYINICNKKFDLSEFLNFYRS